MDAAWVWLFWSELPAGQCKAGRAAAPRAPLPLAGPAGPSRRGAALRRRRAAAAAPVTRRQPPRCDVVAVLTVTM